MGTSFGAKAAIIESAWKDKSMKDGTNFLDFKTNLDDV